MIGVEEEEGGEQPDPQMEQMHQEMQQAMQEMQQQVQQLSQENEQLKADKGADMQRLEMDGMKAQKAAEQKDREIGLKEFEAQKPQPDQTIKMQADMQMARERMQFEANEADKQRQVELAKAIIAKSDEENPVDEGGAMDQAAMMMQQVTAALTAPKMIVRDDMGNIIGSETSDVNTTMDTVSNVVAEQKGGVQNAMAALADAVSTQTRVLMSPKRVVNDENGRPIGMETVFDDDGQQ